jgi:rhodanese-related sulfurtransferase
MYQVFSVLAFAGALMAFTACNAQTGKGGIKEVSVIEASKILGESSDVVLVDVRTPRECQGNSIQNSINIDISNANFEAEVEKIDKNKTILVVCASGNRSARATSYLDAKGYAKAYNIVGGMGAWNRERLPIK